MNHFQGKTETISFSEAIATTQALMTKVSSKQMSEAEIEKAIAALVESRDGARGFFVAYLTSELPLADRPSAGVINGLKSSPEVVGELLIKNLAMSAAMAVTHRRNSDEAQAQGSDRVCQRTTNLIQQLNLDSVTEGLKELSVSAATETGSYQNFLQRWGYDTEQRQMIQKAIASVSTQKA